MKGVVFTGNRQIEIQDFPDPTPGDDDVVLEIKASGMCGTDLHLYRSPGGGPGAAKAMGVAVGEGSFIGGHEPCGIVVARGNRFASLQSIRRKDLPGEVSDLEFAMEGFPSGITMQAAVVPKDQTTWPVVFEARADAPIAGKLADLALRTPADAKVQIKGGVWQNYDLVQDGNNGTYYQTWTDKIAVAVVDELPFKISVEPIKAPLVQSGSLDVKIIAERKALIDSLKGLTKEEAKAAIKAWEEAHKTEVAAARDLAKQIRDQLKTLREDRRKNAGG